MGTPNQSAHDLDALKDKLVLRITPVTKDLPTIQKEHGAPWIRNLDSCVTDVYRAEKETADEPSIPADHAELLRQLNVARVTLPSEHRNGAVDPFRETLLEMGPDGFAEIWGIPHETDPTRNGLLMRDIAQALLERAPTPAEDAANPGAAETRRAARDRREATDALQEVVFDLYDTFLNPRWRQYRPHFSRLPPAVKWGNAYGMAPYAWDTSATLPYFGVECGIVSVPAAYAKRGLLGWAAIAHECCGHDVLSADAGFHAEIEEKLKEKVADLGNVGPALLSDTDKILDESGSRTVKVNPDLRPLGEYWLQRWDETTADVMAILNMGPTAAIALLGYFRARHRARGDRTALSSIDADADGSHPVDIMRAAAWVATLEHLRGVQTRLGKKEKDPAIAKEHEDCATSLGIWKQVLETEATKDLRRPDETEKTLPFDELRKRARISLKISPTERSHYATWNQAVETATKLLEVLDSKLECLGGAKLRDFCDWRPQDDKAVEVIGEFLLRSDFDEKIQELTQKRAELRNVEAYGSDTWDRAQSLREDLSKNVWRNWEMEGLWAGHTVAAAIEIALVPARFFGEESGSFTAIVTNLMDLLADWPRSNPDDLVAALKSLLDKSVFHDDRVFGRLRALVVGEARVDVGIYERLRQLLKDSETADPTVEQLKVFLNGLFDDLVAIVFGRMKKLLALMHNNNRRWGALEQPAWASQPDFSPTEVESLRKQATFSSKDIKSLKEMIKAHTGAAGSESGDQNRG